MVGPDYRYLYTNGASAQLHHARPADLDRAELFRIVGDQVMPQPIDGDERIFLISADPFRAADAGASAAIITMRDLASLALPAEKIVRSLL